MGHKRLTYRLVSCSEMALTTALHMPYLRAMFHRRKKIEHITTLPLKKPTMYLRVPLLHAGMRLAEGVVEGSIYWRDAVRLLRL